MTERDQPPRARQKYTFVDVIPSSMPDNYQNIDESLLKAYQQTNFRLLNSNIQIKIDALNPDLDSFLIDNNAFQWIYLSADNPQSNLVSPAENQRNRAKLLKYCKDHKLRHWPGLAVPASDDWPPEENLLLLDVDKKLGDALAKEFDQKAYLHGRINGLAFLRIMTSSKLDTNNKKDNSIVI